MKGQVKEKTTTTNTLQEKIMCQEILSLSNLFVEAPNRIFDNTTYWGKLPTITTNLISNMIETGDGGDNSKDIEIL